MLMMDNPDGTKPAIRLPIPNSGFLLTKVLKDGKLSVTREGKAKGTAIAAGTADGKTYEIAIKF